MKAITKCPYCGAENSIEINPENITEEQIVLCDHEEGGCDRYFAAFVRVRMETEGKRIEGC